MDHASPFGYQSWLLLLLSAGPAKGPNTSFFTAIRSRRKAMAQARPTKCFVSCLSHLGAAQPQKTRQKYCHYNPFSTCTQTSVGEREGRRGTDRRAGLAVLLKPSFWGGKGESLSNWADSCHPCWDSGTGFLWQARSPTLPPSIAHQSAKTFQQITWHFVKT